MRFIVIDTETTGMNKNKLNITEGHRIIELACVEIINDKITGKTFHAFINPKQKIDPKATKVHGITNDFLTDKPEFKSIVAQFLEFINGADALIIHNADFDLAFIDKEMRLLGWWFEWQGGVIDTLYLARQIFRNEKNRLEDLKERLGIRGKLHSALSDAKMLAEIYLKLISI